MQVQIINLIKNLEEIEHNFNIFILFDSKNFENIKKQILIFSNSKSSI